MNSSCPLEQCQPKQKYNWESSTAKPCGLAFPNCNKSFNLEYCDVNQIYKQDIQPKNDRDFTIPLNSIGPVLEKCQYIPISSNLSEQCKVSFLGTNPLLTEAVRAQKLLLDRPHYTSQVQVGDVKTDEIYSSKFAKYGKGYTDYKDINAGNVMYWLSNTSTEAYASPVYVEPAVVNHSLFVDPMGVVKPEYNRLPLKAYGWDKCCGQECDSFTHDSLGFREDITSSQQRKRNQSDYSYRYGRHYFD
jgi:hypothetical protein